ncbi:MAG TPA: zf-HC2 domain-containing protein, partial [Bryobacteraceae bacterium]|nr:zf-HC2 domain-containing protein [Bryobacteraceae bacterium]
MSDPISCAKAREQLAMLLYGELSFEEEERVESHLDQCAACREALGRERVLHQAFDNVEITPSP